MKQATIIVLCACAMATSQAADSPPPAAKTQAGATQLRQINWEALLPAKERGRYDPAPPSAVHDYLGEGRMAALQNGSYEVNQDLDGALIRMPGFVVPLQSTAGEITEFFLVPYFGACIHVPPPPPNQIVYVKMRKGAGLRSIEDAQWVTGRLHASIKKSDLGAASYTLDGEKMEPYDYSKP